MQVRSLNTFKNIIPFYKYLNSNITLTKHLWVIGHNIKPIDNFAQYDAFIEQMPRGVPGDASLS